MLALQLPSNFFDKPPNAASASLSGREHAVEGFFDEAPAVGAKRPRDPDEEEEPTQETEEMEEAGENEELDIDKIVNEAEAVEVMDLAALKRTMASLERKMQKNQELRIKHSGDPQKFMESEVELFEEVNKLQVLATAPELYGELVRLNGVGKFSELLDHENNDIVLAVIELVNELTDPDALMEADDEAETSAKALVDALMENAFLELLVKQLAKFDETDDDQKQGVYKVLSIVENLSEVLPSVLEPLCERTELISWLLTRLQAKIFDENKLYSSEVLSILVQDSEANQLKVGQNEGMDKLLALTSAWRKKDPQDTEQAELVHNIFNTMCSALLQPANQKALVDGEGIELMVIMLQARKFAARPALKVLDYAMNRNTAACDRFVAAMGLKTLFPGLLKPASILAKKSKDAKSSGSAREDEEHVVSIVASLLLRLSGEAHARTVHKFLENDFEKLDKLMELHEKYYSLVSQVQDDGFENEEEDEDGADDGRSEDEKAKAREDLRKARKYLLRLDKGLYTLQQVDTIIAFVLSEDVAAINTRVRMLLNQMDSDLSQVIEVLAEYRDNAGDGSEQSKVEGDGINMKEVTNDLVDFLREIAPSF